MEPLKTIKKENLEYSWPLVLIMTLLNSNRIIKHNLEIICNFQKSWDFQKNSKKGQKSTKNFKKIIFVTKIPNTFDF